MDTGYRCTFFGSLGVTPKALSNTPERLRSRNSEVVGALEQHQVKQHGLAVLCPDKCTHSQYLVAEQQRCTILVNLHQARAKQTRRCECVHPNERCISRDK